MNNPVRNHSNTNSDLCCFDRTCCASNMIKCCCPVRVSTTLASWNRRNSTLRHGHTHPVNVSAWPLSKCSGLDGKVVVGVSPSSPWSATCTSARQQQGYKHTAEKSKYINQYMYSFEAHLMIQGAQSRQLKRSFARTPLRQALRELIMYVLYVLQNVTQG